jgi:ATP-dependent DNA helicase RecG
MFLKVAFLWQNVLGTSNDLAQFPGLKVELSMRQPLCILGD